MSSDFRRHIPVALNLDLKSMGAFYQFKTFRIKSIKFVDILDFSVTDVAIDNLPCVSLGRENEYRSALIDKNSLIFIENDKVYLKLGRDFGANYVELMNLSNKVCIEINSKPIKNKRVKFASVVCDNTNRGRELLDVIYSSQNDKVSVGFSIVNEKESSLVDSNIIEFKRGYNNKIEAYSSYSGLTKDEIDVGVYDSNGYRSSLGTRICGVDLIDINGMDNLIIPSDYKELVMYSSRKVQYNSTKLKNLVIPDNVKKIVFKASNVSLSDIYLARKFKLSALTSLIFSYFSNSYPLNITLKGDMKGDLRNCKSLSDVLKIKVANKEISKYLNIVAL
jgi:hypothetical protein